MPEINIIQNMPGNGASLISRLLPYSNAFMQLAGAYGRMLGGGQSGTAYLAQRDMQEIQGQASYNLLARSVYNKDYYSLNSAEQDLIDRRVREVAQEAKWRQEAAAWQDSHLGTDPRFNPYIPENMRGQITTDSLTRAYNDLAREQAAYSNITQPTVPGGRPYDLTDSNYSRFDTSTAPPGYHWDREGNLVADSTEDRGTDRTRETDIDPPPPPPGPIPPIEDPTGDIPEPTIDPTQMKTKEDVDSWIAQEFKKGGTTESIWRDVISLLGQGLLPIGLGLIAQSLFTGSPTVMPGATGGEYVPGVPTEPTTPTPPTPPTTPTEPDLQVFEVPNSGTGDGGGGTGDVISVPIPGGTTPGTPEEPTTPTEDEPPTDSTPPTEDEPVIIPPPISEPRIDDTVPTPEVTPVEDVPEPTDPDVPTTPKIPDLSGLTGGQAGENQWGHPGAGNTQPIDMGINVKPSAVSLLDFDWDGKENKKSGLSSLLGEAFSWRGALSK